MILRVDNFEIVIYKQVFITKVTRKIHVIDEMSTYLRTGRQRGTSRSVIAMQCFFVFEGQKGNSVQQRGSISIL